ATDRADGEHRSRDTHVVLRHALLDEVPDDDEHHEFEGRKLSELAPSDGPRHDPKEEVDRARAQDHLHQGATHVWKCDSSSTCPCSMSRTVPSWPHCCPIARIASSDARMLRPGGFLNVQ